MFVPCPHCGYLVALIVPAPASRAATQRCPRCDGVLGFEDIATADSTGSTDSNDLTVSTDHHDAGAGDDAALDTIALGSAAADSSAADGAATTAREAPMVDGRASAEPDAVQCAATGTAGSAPAALPANPVAPARTAPARRAPSFVLRARAPSPRSRRRGREYAAIAALVLLLAVQLLLAQRAALAANERWRPLVLGACTLLRCDVPAWREPTAYTMLDRNVRPDPGKPGVLTVNASFRNDARWPQRWPTLVLSLSDVNGQQVASRTLAPADYRPRDARDDALLAPGESASMQLEVIEPAPRIVAFQFEFD